MHQAGRQTNRTQERNCNPQTLGVPPTMLSHYYTLFHFILRKLDARKERHAKETEEITSLLMKRMCSAPQLGKLLQALTAKPVCSPVLPLSLSGTLFAKPAHSDARSGHLPRLSPPLSLMIKLPLRL